MPNFSIENNFENLTICGIDEAGRGPLAGPVVACAIILNRNFDLSEINDSKKLSKKKREKIFDMLITKFSFGVGIVDNEKIDEINILQATKLAMKKAVENLHEKLHKKESFPEIILVDGNFSPFEKFAKIQEILPIIKGDQKSLSIAAASIIAKVTRDKIMEEIGNKFPEYGFKNHAGYPTKYHVEKIKNFGICEFHRKTFQPIKNLINANN
jgi:ribonuclease HII